MKIMPEQLYMKDGKVKLRSKLFHTVKPYVSSIAVIAISTLLVFIIYLTQSSLQWITFLSGILLAAILAVVVRTSRAERIVVRRTVQLTHLKDKIESEILLRKKAEEAVAAGKPLLQLIDEAKSLMVAFVDADGCYQYHNKAFSEWLNLRPERINGRQMHEVLGARSYGEISAAVRQSMGGKTVQYEQKQKLPNGSVVLVSVEHIPQFAGDGKVTGFHVLATAVTESCDMPELIGHEPQAAGNIGDGIDNGDADQEMFVNSFSEQITGQHDEGKQILEAIEKGAFKLFCQRITPLKAGSGNAEHYEILLRLMEEEDNMIPPGAFFPLAEEHGLMSQLDRWVVRHVMEHVAAQKPQAGQMESSIFFINLSLDTITDPSFPEFMERLLLEYGVPGASLCFEILNSELASRSVEMTEFARQVRQRGCRIALSGFGRERVLFDQVHGVHVEFLKIDGSVIFNILHDPVNLAKVIAINRVAKKIGIRTIAELVESENIIAKLREVGIDFAQGFGISRPGPLADIE